MAMLKSRIAAATAGLAAFSMTAMPAAAVDLPVTGQSGVVAYDAGAENVEQYRYRRHRDRDRGIDAGDVIAGVAVIGAIAAIASAASSNKKRERDQVRYRDRDPRYDNSRNAYDSRGMERAVDMCVDQVERGSQRVTDIDRAERNASGWYVGGRISGGESFSCRIDNDGRIRNVDFGDDYGAYGDTPAYYGAAAGEPGPQLSDEAYARARAATRYGSPDYGGSNEYSYEDQRYGQQEPTYGDGPRPAYPGGPLPGEEGYGDTGTDYQGDGRYDIATNR